MVATTKPPMASQRRKPIMGNPDLLMDFSNDDVSQNGAPDLATILNSVVPKQPTGQVQAPAQNSSFDMPELQIEGTPNKLYDYDKEIKLLGQYSSDVMDQPEKDYAAERSIRTAIMKMANARLTPKQLDDISDQENQKRLIGGIMSSTPKVFFANNQQRNLGGVDFHQATKDAIEGVRAPIRNSDYLQNQYQHDTLNNKLLSDIERGNLTARGKDIENFSTANKQTMSVVDTKQKADPSSHQSQLARQAASDALQQAMDYADLPTKMGGEKRGRYRELAGFYRDMQAALTNASYNDVERIHKLIESKDKETGRRVGEDLKELNSSMQAEKLGAMLGKDNFSLRKAMSETGEDVAKQQDAVNTMMRIYELSQDPEVRKGFGTSKISEILGMTDKGLTPKQAEYRQLLAKGKTQEVKQNFGLSFTSTDQKLANGYMLSEDDSPSSLSAKAPGALKFAGKGLFNSFSKHYNLGTGENFSRDFDIKYDNNSRDFSAASVEKMRNLSPWDMVPKPTSGYGGVSRSIVQKASGNLPEAPKIMTSADVDFAIKQFAAKNIKKTREDIIKEAQAHGYVIRP